MYKIYGVTRSRASRCLWLLEELGWPYEQEQIDPATGNNRTAAYLALNPAGKVPALSEGDFAMTESHAILLWLAQKAGAPFWPADALTQGRVLQWTLWTAAELEPVTAGILRANREGGPAVAERVAALQQTGAEFLKLIEIQLNKTPFLAGPSLTVADISLGSNLAFAEVFGLDLAPFPKIAAWRSALQARPAYQRIFGPVR